MAKTAAERQRECRERKKAREEAMKYEQIKFRIGHGTRAALDKIKPDDMEDAEWITLMIHSIADESSDRMQALLGVTISRNNS